MFAQDSWPSSRSTRLVSTCAWLGLVLVLLASQLPVLVSPVNALDTSGQQSVLDSIQAHEQALRQECLKYESSRWTQLIEFAKFTKNQFQTPKPIRAKIPSVCLYILSSRFETTLGGTHLQQAAETNTLRNVKSRRLEFVDWLYSHEELLAKADNMTKRHASPSHDHNDYLSNYLFNRELAEDEDDGTQNSIPDDKFHKDLGRLLHNKHVRYGIQQNRELIGKSLSPVVLIPGLLGSRLQARTNKSTGVNMFCSRQKDWNDVWLSLHKLLPVVVDCWLDNLKLEHNPDTYFTSQPAGVQVRVPDFGSVDSVRYLDQRQPALTEYYHTLIDQYEQLGYTPDVNLLAAPYDFRLAPQEMSNYFDKLRKLIEYAHAQQVMGKKVTLICHSMGCTHVLVFLRQQSPAWRQTHIRKLIALSSPWGGSIKALKAMVVGDSLDLPLISETKMRKLARTYPSIAFLMPQPEVFSKSNKNRPDGDVTLVETPTRKYKINDMAQLFSDLNLTTQYSWFEQTTKLLKPLEPLPDVNIDCIYSSNVATPETMIFRKQEDFPDGDYELIKGEGDGTVNMESLMICDDWARILPDKVRVKIIMNVDHVGVLSHKATVSHIVDDALS